MVVSTRSVVVVKELTVFVRQGEASAADRSIHEQMLEEMIAS